MSSTPNGYDPRWVEAINTVLADRETGIQITDLNEAVWDEFIGPMCDAIEYRRDDLAEDWLVEYAESEVAQ